MGGGPEYRSVKDPVRGQITSGGTTSKIDGLISVGYNGDSFLAAIIVTGDGTTYTTQSLSIPSVIGDAKFAIGAHF